MNDLRWIREPFLSDAKEHGFIVVHGHTIVERVEERPNRIAIDTGAYHQRQCSPRSRSRTTSAGS